MAPRKIVKYYNDRYKGSLSDNDCIALEQLIELDIECGGVQDLTHVIYDLSSSDVDLLIDSRGEESIATSYIEKKLGTMTPMQTVGSAFLYFSKRCILADSVGLGKTAQACGFLNILQSEAVKSNKVFRYLYLTENSLLEQTQRELVRFTGMYSHLVLGTAKPAQSFSDSNVNRLQYSVIAPHSVLNQGIFIEWYMQFKQRTGKVPFDCLIIDESSPFGSRKNGLRTIMKQLEPDFEYLVMLNATPVEKDLEILYNQLDVLDSSFMPTLTNFRSTYCEMDYTRGYPVPKGYKDVTGLRYKVGYRYFDRTRKDKGAVMEDCRGYRVSIPLTKPQKDLMSRTSMYQMVYDCPSALNLNLDPVSEECNAKLSALDFILDAYCSDADSILIYTHYKETHKVLSDWLTLRGISNRVLNGELTNRSERDSIVRGFTNYEFKVLITNIQKGLNFGNCNYAIFFGLNPNPSKMVQFEGRFTREFDIYGKNLFLLITEGKETRYLSNVIKERTKMISDSTNTDYSLIFELIMGTNLVEVVEDEDIKLKVSMYEV